MPLLTGEKTPVRPACATSVGERQQTQSSAASTSLNVRERESERTAVIEKENVKPWLMCSSSRSSSTTGLSGGETCLEENKISHVHLKQQRQTVETCWRSVPSPMGANVWQQRASHSHTGRVIREKVGFFFYFLPPSWNYLRRSGRVRKLWLLSVRLKQRRQSHAHTLGTYQCVLTFTMYIAE